MFAAFAGELLRGIAQHVSRERKIEIREKGLGTLQEGELFVLFLAVGWWERK